MSKKKDIGETPPMPDADALKATKKQAANGNIIVGKLNVIYGDTVAKGEDVAAVVKKEQSDSGHSS